jgi:predicted phage terminase large subunit-like protein
MRVERVRFPALAEEDDVLGRVPGQALCSERFDEVALAGIRADVGPTSWAGLYQGRPIPAGGGMFKRDAFRHFTTRVVNGKSWYQLGEKVVAAEHCWRFATFDPAFVRGKRSDYTALAVWDVAPTDPTSLVLLDVRRVRMEHAEHVPLIEQVWQTYRPSWIGIEKQMATLSTWTEVQRKGVVIRWLIAEKNKVARAETAVAIVDAGRLWVPANAAWLPDYIEELVTFPVAAHDDQVDVTSYACIELARRAVHARPPKKEPSTHDERCWASLQKRRKRRRDHPVLGRI